MTFADLINKVLRALREDTITTSLTEAYVELVGQYVNEAKTDIEDMGPWYALRTVVSDTLSVGVSTLAFTADTDDRSYLLTNNAGQPEAYITTSNFWHRLEVISQAEMEYLWIVSPTQSNANPSYVSFSRAAGGMTATFFPAPDLAYTTKFTWVVPQDEFTVYSDVLSIPGDPVWREALVRAMEERGEEFAGPLDGARARAAKALSNAMVRDFGADSYTFVAQ
jgi:hypothetical protein